MRLPLGLTLLAIAAASAGCTNETSTDEGDAGDVAPLVLEPWAWKFGGNVIPSAVASGPDGDIYLGGTFQGSVSFGGGWLEGTDPGTLFVAHLDPKGSHVMSGSTGADDELRSVAVSPDGAMYVAGDFSHNVNFGTGKLDGTNDGYLAGFNPDGTSAFARAFSGNNFVFVDDVATTPDGDVVIAARADEATDFGAGPGQGTTGQAQMVLASYDHNGAHLWEKRFTGYALGPMSLAADAKGNVYLGAATYQTVDVGGVSIAYAAFVAKLDGDGVVRWVRGTTLSNSGYLPSIQDLSVDGPGNVYLAGYYYYDPFEIGGIKVPPSQTQSAYLIKLAPDGTGVYAKGFPSDNYQTGLAIAAAKDGEALLAMTSYYPVDFGGGPVGLVTDTSLLLARFGATGEHLKSMALDGNGNESVVDLAADPLGQPVLVGTFDNLLDIGKDRLVASGGPDMFVARLDF